MSWYRSIWERQRGTLTSMPAYFSCFISYSSADQKFAEKLCDDLRSYGADCWFAPDDLKIGAETRSSIDQAIMQQSKLVLVLSAHSVVSSWVQKEVEAAFEKERLPPRDLMLFPLRIDDAVMTTRQAWAADIRRMRNIGDFRGWSDPPLYQKALGRLLRDLQRT
jgi:hypothetical protein